MGAGLQESEDWLNSNQFRPSIPDRCSTSVGWALRGWSQDSAGAREAMPTPRRCSDSTTPTKSNAVAADPVQGGHGEGIAAAQPSVQAGPARAVADRDGAGAAHVRKNGGALDPGVGQGLVLGFGVHPGQAVDGGSGGAEIAVNDRF